MQAQAFVGKHVNRIDRKGRVSVPARFRAVFGPECTTICLMESFRRLEALDVYLPGMIERLAGLTDPFADDDKGSPESSFGAGDYVSFDAEGRIVLPDNLRAYARITDRVCFLGRGSFFQMWEPEAGSAYQDQTCSRSRLKENSEALRRRLAGRDGEAAA